MDPLKLREVGRSGVMVTQLGFGGAALAGLYAAVPEEEAVDAVRDASKGGVRLFDTAPLYGHGLSEHLIGHGLRGQPRASHVLQTKIGRLLKPAGREKIDGGLFATVLPFDTVFDYSYDGAMRALEDSLQRLGMDRVDLLLIHAADPSVHGAERFPAIFREVMTGAYRALEALRAQRVVAGIGAGLNLAETCLEFARAGSFDLFLLSGRYTLAEQGALEGFLPYCEEQGISVVVGSPFNSGILASGVTADARYEYRTAPPEVAARVKAISELCGRHGVPLRAAALQFPLAHPAVVSVVPGLRSPAEVQAALAAMRLPIPSQLWDDLKGHGLLRNDAPTPAGAET